MHYDLLRRIEWRVNWIALALAGLIQLERKMAADLTALQAEVAAVTTVEASAVALLNGLSQALKDALAANDPAAIQSVIDNLEASKTSLAAAVAANTPATPGV